MNDRTAADGGQAVDAASLRNWLYDDHRIEVPVTTWTSPSGDTRTVALTDRDRGVDLVRELAQYLAQELIEVEATQAIGAGRYERFDERVTERNGHRDRVLTTKAGDLELAIPKLRKGSFFPSILEPRRRIDQALYALASWPESLEAMLAERGQPNCWMTLSTALATVSSRVSSIAPSMLN